MYRRVFMSHSTYTYFYLLIFSWLAVNDTRATRPNSKCSLSSPRHEEAYDDDDSITIFPKVRPTVRTIYACTYDQSVQLSAPASLPRRRVTFDGDDASRRHRGAKRKTSIRPPTNLGQTTVTHDKRQLNAAKRRRI